jgi:hypothetical protein
MRYGLHNLSEMQTLLYLLAQTFQTKPFRPINEALRLFLVRAMPGFVQLALGGKWVLRNSLTEPWNFNPLFSDIDLTLIVEERNQSDVYVEKKLQQHARLKRWFKILGEVEVYSPEEWQIKNQLLEHHGELIAYSRSLRKINWMKGDFRNRQGPYHRAKPASHLQMSQGLSRQERTILELEPRGIPSRIPVRSLWPNGFLRNRFSQ